MTIKVMHCQFEWKSEGAAITSITSTAGEQ